MDTENFSENSDSLSTQDFSAGNTSHSETPSQDLEQARGQSKDPAFTPEEARKAYLRQEDYTRKTQELAKERETYKKELEEYRSDKKFLDNLHYDLANVRNMPELAEKFREIYPKKFHPLLEAYLSSENSQMTSQSRNLETPQDSLEPESIPPQMQKYFQKLIEEKMAPIKGIEEQWKRTEAEKSEQFVNSSFDSGKTKYPYADEAVVIERCLRYQGSGHKLTQDVVHQIFKQEHERMIEFGKKYQGEQTKHALNKQKQAFDTGSGGGVPGKGVKTYKDLNEHVKDYLAGM